MANQVNISGIVVMNSSSRISAVISEDGRVKTPVIYITLIDSQGHVMDFEGTEISPAEDGVQAEGYIQVFDSPVSGETSVIINGVTFTFVDEPVLETDVQNDLSTNTAALNLETVLQASVNPLITVASYVRRVGDTEFVDITYNESGEIGNDFTLAVAGSGCMRSGPTLENGVDEIPAEYTYSLPVRSVS